MPLLFAGDGKEPIKVACKSCIDGHRSPTCFHLDRILVQVRQPGRPRVHCNHGKPSWGQDRCKQCYPTIAYVVPGHGATHARKCSCHRDKNEPIHDWQRTTEEMAEHHERSRAQELEEKRATRRMSQRAALAQSQSQAQSQAHSQSQSQPQSQPQTPAPSTCCSSHTASNTTPSAAPSAVQSPFATPGIRYAGSNLSSQPEPMQLSGPHCGHNATSSSYLTQDMSSVTRQAITPWVQGQLPFQGASLLAMAECDCGDAPGQCQCVGCFRHADNKETTEYVTQLWDTHEQQLPETPAGERQNPFAFPQAFAAPSLDFPMFEGSPQNTVGSPESLPGLEDQKTLPQFQVWTAMGECPSCNCGPGCRCAQCPCHQPASGPSPTSMQSSMSSEFREQILQSSGHDSFRAPNMPDRHSNASQSSGSGDVHLNVDYMDLSHISADGMGTQDQHAENARRHRPLDSDLARMYRPVENSIHDSAFWSEGKGAQPGMPGVVSNGAYLHPASPSDHMHPPASLHLAGSTHVLQVHDAGEQSTFALRSHELPSDPIGTLETPTASMPPTVEGTALLEPALL